MSLSLETTSSTKRQEALLQLYEQLLDANQSAFELQLFTLAFHALSGALSCAAQLQQLEPVGETNRLLEIERRAEEQIELLSPSISPESPNFSASHLSFYRALEQIVDNQRALHPISGETYHPLSPRAERLSDN